MPKTSTSTAVATRKPSAGSVVSIKEQLKAQAAAMSDRISPPGGNAIRLSPGKFTLPDGSTTAGPLDLVVVDFVSTNSLYEGPYNPKDIKPPVCFAVGQNPLKLAPVDASPDIQAKTCGECPMNQWGSGANSGKACKNERVLAVLPPDGDETTPLWKLKVSPTGLKSFDGFVNSTARVFETGPVGVVVSVSLKEDTDYPVLVFSDPRPNENLAAHFARQEEARKMLEVVPDMTPRENAAPAKKVAAKKVVGARR